MADENVQAVNNLVEQRAQELKDQQQQQPQQQNTDEGKKNEGGAGEGQQQQQQQQQGANEVNQDGQQQQQEQQQQQNAPAPDRLEAFLKEHNLASLDELVDKLKPKVEETPEQIKKREELQQANLISFAVENDLMSLENINKYQELKNTTDEDLVFEAFSKDRRDEILEELGDEATEEQIIEKLRKDFDSEYPVSSKNEKIRQRAENKIKKEAAEMRQPLESSFTEAKARYDEEMSMRTDIPKYNQTITGLAASAVPDTFQFFADKDGEDEISVPVKVTPEVKKTILDSVENKIMKNPQTYLLYKQGKTEQIQEMISDHVELLMYKHLGESGKKEIAKVYLGRGVAKGSNTGASNSFAVNQAGIKSDVVVDEKTAKAQVLDSTRQKK